MVDNQAALTDNSGMPIPATPISDIARRAIERCRTRIGSAGLTIEEMDDTQWRVTAPDGQWLLYFPLEDRWRKGGQWGRGTLTLISELGAS